MGALTRADAAAALRLLFLLEAARLELLPPALREDALRLAGVSSRDAGARRLALSLSAALLDSRDQLGLTGLEPLSADKADAAGALRAALAHSAGAASPRAAAERLAQLCQGGTRRERKGTGSFYTPRPIADLVAAGALRGLLDGRGVGVGAPLWLRGERRLPGLGAGFPSAWLRAGVNPATGVSAGFTKPAPRSGDRRLRILDPAAGAGAFLVAMVDAIAEAVGEGQNENIVRRAVVRDCLRGFELDPLAAEACRLALWLVASRPAGRWAATPAAAIAVRDTLRRPPRRRAFDLVVGNPPWGVKLSRELAGALARRARPPVGGQPALAGHRDSFLHFLALAAEAARDDGAVGLVLPDALLWQVKYEGMRRHLLERFRPLRVALLPATSFPAVAAPACALCLVGRGIAPGRFRVADLRKADGRARTCSLRSRRAWSAACEAPTTAPHHCLLPPPPWLDRLARRMAGKHRTLGDLHRLFRFHDVGINYGTAALGRRALYTGERRHPLDIPVTRGRDFGALTPVGHSGWLRHDWRDRLPPGAQVWVREEIYRTAPKLLLRQTGDRPVATIDRDGVFFGRSVIAVTACPEAERGGRPEEELLWLAAVMNSATFAALYRAVTPEAGRTFAQVKVSKLKLVPLPVGADRKMAELARDLLEEGDEERRQALIARMDERVARAYGLTRQEWQRVIAFVGPTQRGQPRRARRAGRRSAQP